MMRFFLILAIFAGTARAQWVKVASEGDSVTATATVRYGAPQGAASVSGTPCATVGGCWIQIAVTGTFTVGNTFFKTDPIPNTVKEMDVLETTSAQSMTVNGKAVQVPAVSGVTPPPTVNTITFSIDETVSGVHVTGSCTVTPVVGK